MDLGLHEKVGDSGVRMKEVQGIFVEVPFLTRPS